MIRNLRQYLTTPILGALANSLPTSNGTAIKRRKHSILPSTKKSKIKNR